jgi:DNA-binding SARP family transcriptional activator/tetratricopeptide (TPR) repeat protein
MEFRILGPVEVWKDGAREALDGSKQRTVMASLLLAEGRIVSDARLSSLLWGERPPMTVNAQIYTYVSRLRKLLGPETSIERQRPGYLLRIGSASLDYAEFRRLTQRGLEALSESRPAEASESLREALSLWRGPALANVTEYLAELELPSLEEARMAALESRIEADLALDPSPRLVAELTGLVAAYPLRERLRAQLMTALLRNDRQADALGVYQDGRRVLAEELGVDPSPTLSRAYQEILAGDVGTATLSDQAASPAPSVTTYRPPAMLPRDIADFTGRRDHLDRLAGLLTAEPEDGPARTVVMVTGMPGVGKTALAVRAAHDVADRFPDGALYVDLGGSGGTPADPLEVIGSFLRALRVSESAIPSDRSELIRLYRSQLANRRMLIVLDNAISDRQVRILLPGGPGCAVVVTSRTYLTTLEGAHMVDLDPMDADEALAMLTSIVGGRVAAEPAEAARIVELCGRLPLALRAVGARLTGRPHWALAQLADRLADERRRLDVLRVGDIDVRARLEEIYHRLQPQPRAALRRLASLDVPDFPSWAAAAVLGAGEDAGEDAVEALADARLLEAVRSDPPGWSRYRFHGLVRLVARERAAVDDTATERDDAIDRAFGAWLAFASEVDRRLPHRYADGSGGGAPRWRLTGSLVNRLADDPLAWFDVESDALMALVEQAAASGREASAWELANTLTHYFDLRGRYDDWRATHKKACTAARSSGDTTGEATILLGLAELSAAVDDTNARLTYADRAARLFRRLGDQPRLADALVHIGNAYRQTGHHDRALDSLGQALTIAAESRHPGGEARAHHGIGGLLRDRGDLVRAAESFSHSETIWRKLGNRRLLAVTLRGAAAVDLEDGRLSEAEDRLDECLAMLEDGADPAGEAHTLNGLADVYRGSRPDQARYLYERAARAFCDLGLANKSGHAAALHGLGELALAAGEVERAVELLNRARDAWRALAMPMWETRTLRPITDAELGRGNPEAAGRAWRVAIELREWMRGSKSVPPSPRRDSPAQWSEVSASM